MTNKNIIKTRCTWCKDDPLYVAYHDKEWGVPVRNDAKLFEFLVLESMQAGLSWITILRKRENFRIAFDNFDPYKIIRYTDKKILRLMDNPGIIRNEKKILATIKNANLFLELQSQFGKFSKYIWRFTDGKVIQNNWKHPKQIPATTKESDAMAKDLKKRGFTFLGSTTCYAHMQACGMVNDHVMDCFRYQPLSS